MLLEKAKREGFEYLRIPEKKSSRPYGGISDKYFRKAHPDRSSWKDELKIETPDDLLDEDEERRLLYQQ